jgi:phage terminase small subunit
MALTQKQENFCLAYIKTGNASESYRQAYDTESMKDATIANSAYKLLKNDDVTARINSLQARNEKQAIITLEQRKELLSRWVWEEETPNAMKALDLLNKMESVYIQKNQTELSGAVGVTFQIDLGDSK